MDMCCVDLKKRVNNFTVDLPSIIWSWLNPYFKFEYVIYLEGVSTCVYDPEVFLLLVEAGFGLGFNGHEVSLCGWVC